MVSVIMNCISESSSSIAVGKGHNPAGTKTKQWQLDPIIKCSILQNQVSVEQVKAANQVLWYHTYIETFHHGWLPQRV